MIVKKFDISGPDTPYRVENYTYKDHIIPDIIELAMVAHTKYRVSQHTTMKDRQDMKWRHLPPGEMLHGQLSLGLRFVIQIYVPGL